MPAADRRRPVWPFLVPALALAVLALPACENGGHFTVLGYTTKPNYREDIKTVRVPIFKNVTYRDSVRQGLEFELTRAVVREIEAKTPYKVVGCDADADTELTGTIVSLNKNVINRNELNEVRDAETVLAVEVRWQDLRSGEYLSRPARAPGTPPPPPPEPGQPKPPIPPPVMVFSQANFRPELGESTRSAFQKNVDRLAVQVVSLMEQPW